MIRDNTIREIDDTDDMDNNIVNGMMSGLSTQVNEN